MVKEALIEQLVRLGATPIKGTPNLLMKNRTPEELAQLEQSVAGGIRKVEEPLERGLNKVLFHPKSPLSRLSTGAQYALWGTGREAIKHPEAALLEALAPGGTILGGGWIAGKKALEHSINRFLPAVRSAV